ncbi:hypothetical protein R1flu_007647 [Riccia fluitans]|uniref:Uncharacterized protein n=1 Tax=Riccia fluitans TaxID=41844 RepID=A0ABD1YZF8_9MARC
MDKQVQELATQLERAQFQLKKVRTKADLKAAFADLDTVESQLDKEHERNSKLQDKVSSPIDPTPTTSPSLNGLIFPDSDSNPASSRHQSDKVPGHVQAR